MTQTAMDQWGEWEWKAPPPSDMELAMSAYFDRLAIEMLLKLSEPSIFRRLPDTGACDAPTASVSP